MENIVVKEYGEGFRIDVSQFSGQDDISTLKTILTDLSDDENEPFSYEVIVGADQPIKVSFNNLTVYVNSEGDEIDPTLAQLYTLMLDRVNSTLRGMKYPSGY